MRRWRLLRLGARGGGNGGGDGGGESEELVVDGHGGAVGDVRLKAGEEQWK